MIRKFSISDAKVSVRDESIISDDSIKIDKGYTALCGVKENYNTLTRVIKKEDDRSHDYNNNNYNTLTDPCSEPLFNIFFNPII
jgi:hypothetical protein